jgi:excisionase family DNA binding protein
MAGALQLITVEDAADVLSVSPATVYRRIADGDIPVVNIGRTGGRPRLRINLAALEQYAADHGLDIPKRTIRRGRAA